MKRFLLAWFCAACGLCASCTPTVSDESKQLDGPQSYFVFDTVKFENVTNPAAPLGKDPVATGWVWATDLPENLFVAGGRSYSAGIGDYIEWARLELYNLYALLDDSMTYSILAPPVSGPPADGTALFFYVESTSNTRCEATGGSAVLQENGPVGDYIQGTYTITGWQPASEYSCTLGAPKSGSFLIKREADDRDENDGQGVDTIAVTDDFLTVNLTENNLTPNDPKLAAEYDSSGAGSMLLYLSMQANRSLGIYEREFFVEYDGGTGLFDYSLSQFTITVRYFDGTGPVSCPISSGTLNIINDGGVGGLIVGNFSLALSSPPSGCPPTFVNANFSVTRMADF
jgi:hypothetical protein